ncbi:MAG: hypothetical protein HON32_02725 [Francisellaceae bacterium]|nr:hypothetical protein [Francisellaceae bacterium]MBT6538702.1 hypothetical protein [Francisellaceae bacterium]
MSFNDIVGTAETQAEEIEASSLIHEISIYLDLNMLFKLDSELKKSIQSPEIIRFSQLPKKYCSRNIVFMVYVDLGGGFVSASNIYAQDTLLNLIDHLLDFSKDSGFKVKARNIDIDLSWCEAIKLMEVVRSCYLKLEACYEHGLIDFPVLLQAIKSIDNFLTKLNLSAPSLKDLVVKLKLGTKYLVGIITNLSMCKLDYKLCAYVAEHLNQKHMEQEELMDVLREIIPCFTNFPILYYDLSDSNKRALINEFPRYMMVNYMPDDYSKLLIDDSGITSICAKKEANVALLFHVFQEQEKAHSVKIWSVMSVNVLTAQQLIILIDNSDAVEIVANILSSLRNNFSNRRSAQEIENILVALLAKHHCVKNKYIDDVHFILRQNPSLAASDVFDKASQLKKIRVTAKWCEDGNKTKALVFLPEDMSLIRKDHLEIILGMQTPTAVSLNSEAWAATVHGYTKYTKNVIRNQAITGALCSDLELGILAKGNIVYDEMLEGVILMSVAKKSSVFSSWNDCCIENINKLIGVLKTREIVELEEFVVATGYFPYSQLPATDLDVSSQYKLKALHIKAMVRLDEMIQEKHEINFPTDVPFASMEKIFAWLALYRDKITWSYSMPVWKRYSNLCQNDILTIYCSVSSNATKKMLESLGSKDSIFLGLIGLKKSFILSRGNLTSEFEETFFSDQLYKFYNADEMADFLLFMVGHDGYSFCDSNLTEIAMYHDLSSAVLADLRRKIISNSLEWARKTIINNGTITIPGDIHQKAISPVLELCSGYDAVHVSVEKKCWNTREFSQEQIINIGTAYVKNQVNKNCDYGYGLTMMANIFSSFYAIKALLNKVKTNVLADEACAWLVERANNITMNNEQIIEITTLACEEITYYPEHLSNEMETLFMERGISLKHLERLLENVRMVKEPILYGQNNARVFKDTEPSRSAHCHLRKVKFTI